MTQPKLAVLFADISGSTSLYERLGDIDARRQIAACLSTITEQVARHAGVVVKTIGDELMCTFADAECAVRAAIGMNSVLVGDNQSATDGPVDLSIRVGLHFGPVIREQGDVFGDTVNVAARMAGLAKGGQIITTEPTVKNLSPVLRATTRLFDHAPVKGKKGEITIYEVIWQQEDATNLASSVLASPSPAGKLVLRYKQKEVQLDYQCPSASLGRSEPCDIIVNSERASRRHARIECRRGKYIIVDQSTNGTYVRFTDDEQIFLRWEEMPLKGQGMISLGLPFDKDPQDIVHFVCEY